MYISKMWENMLYLNAQAPHLNPLGLNAWLDVWPWENYLTSLGLIFLICKIETITTLTPNAALCRGNQLSIKYKGGTFSLFYWADIERKIICIFPVCWKKNPLCYLTFCSIFYIHTFICQIPANDSSHLKQYVNMWTSSLSIDSYPFFSWCSIRRFFQ